LLVNPRDASAIADGVKRFHDDAGFRERSIAIGRETAAQYTFEKYVTQVHKLLDDFEPIRRMWPSGPVPRT
jgi:glycosyltransferase involved in cell wall biosynthesis